ATPEIYTLSLHDALPILLHDAVADGPDHGLDALSIGARGPQDEFSRLRLRVRPQGDIRVLLLERLHHVVEHAFRRHPVVQLTPDVRPGAGQVAKLDVFVDGAELVWHPR